LKLTHCLGLTQEHSVNYVPSSFYIRGEDIMARFFAEEALALTALSLFLAMVAVWAQVLGVV
jgi:sulfur transfer complex TusBCD TusB component (DsrH family)